MRVISDRTAAVLFGLASAFATVTISQPPPFAQGTKADYQRAAHLWQLASGKVCRDHVSPHWSDNGNSFWYRVVTGPDTCEFVLVDAEKGVRQAAFDHSRLAEALGTAGYRDVRADRLPISELLFDLKEREVDFRINGEWWRCGVEKYRVRRLSQPFGWHRFAPKRRPNAGLCVQRQTPQTPRTLVFAASVCIRLL
jgi:hypothetical protein